MQLCLAAHTKRWQRMTGWHGTFSAGLSGGPRRSVDCSVCTALCTDLAPAPSPLYTNTSLHMPAAILRRFGTMLLCGEAQQIEPLYPSTSPRAPAAISLLMLLFTWDSARRAADFTTTCRRQL